MMLPASLSATELSITEVHHAVTCPDPGESPCIMKRPFSSSEYTIITKSVDIQEGNGVWIVRFKTDLNRNVLANQNIRLLDFYGGSHVIDVTFDRKVNQNNTAKQDPVPQIRTIIKNASVKNIEPDSKKSNFHIDFKVYSDPK
jgi:hypothetical protein